MTRGLITLAAGFGLYATGLLLGLAAKYVQSPASHEIPGGVQSAHDSQRTLPLLPLPLDTEPAKSVDEHLYAEARGILARGNEILGRRRSKLHVLFENLNTEQVREALEHLKNEPNALAAREVLLARWAQLDGKAALKYALNSEREIKLVIREWHGSKPEEVESTVLGMRDTIEKKLALRALCNQVAESDPAHAFALAETIPSNWHKTYLCADILLKMAEQDRAAALRQAKELPVAQAEAVCPLIKEWAAEDPRAALAWVQTVTSSELKGRTMKALAEGWATVNPKEAVEAIQAEAQKLGISALGSLEMEAAFTGWIERDLDSGLEWADRQPAEQRMRLLMSCSDQLVRIDPARVLAKVLKRAPSENRGQLLATLARDWAKTDAVAALTWLRTQQIPEIQKTALPAMAQSLDGGSVLQVAQTMPLEFREEITSMILSTRLGDDTAAWISRQPDGALKNKYVATYAESYARMDKPGASAWVKTIPPGPMRDLARTIVEATDSPFEHLKPTRDPDSDEIQVFHITHPMSFDDTDFVHAVWSPTPPAPEKLLLE